MSIKNTLANNQDVIHALSIVLINHIESILPPQFPTDGKKNFLIDNFSRLSQAYQMDL